MRWDGTPGKPEFFAEQKMRPNNSLQGEALDLNAAIAQSLEPSRNICYFEIRYRSLGVLRWLIVQ
jgi:hypothetical protein